MNNTQHTPATALKQSASHIRRHSADATRTMVASWAPRNYIAVIGSPASLRRKNGLAAQLRQLGVARFNRTSGFDDFVVVPFSAMELYVRIRALGLGGVEASSESSHRLGNITRDRGWGYRLRTPNVEEPKAVPQRKLRSRRAR